MALSILSLKEITKTFQMGEVAHSVLRGIDLEIQKGEILVILGPSGSGKTTLLNLIGGMDSPSSGEVFFEDQNLTEKSSGDLTIFRREEVGFVFQHYNLVPTLTARENIQIATEIAPHPLGADEVLEMVGLLDHAEFFPSQMSGGQQQRVAIGRAIAKRPRLLLCDEPTGALDFETGKQILKLLQQVNRQLSMTIVIITHNTAIAVMAHRVIHLISGKIHRVEVHEKPVEAEEISW